MPNCKEFLCCAEHFGALSHKEALFLDLVVLEVLALLAGNPCHIGLLARVNAMLLHEDAFSQEVQLDLIGRFAVVQSELDSASASACSQQVVLIDHRADHVLAPSDLPQRLCLGLRFETRHDQVDHLRLARRIVVLQTGLAGFEVVTREHGLLGGLSLAASHVCLNDLGSSAACRLRSGGVGFLIVALQHGHRSLLGVVGFKVRLHHTESLLEVVVYFAALSGRGIGHLLSWRFVLELSFGQVLRVSILLEVHLVGGQLLLSQLVGDRSLQVVLGASQRGLGLPVGGGAEGDLGSGLVETEGCLVHVPASEDARLQVLVLAILAVEPVFLQWRAGLDSANPRVLPVDTLSHQAAIALILMGSVYLSSLAVKFLVDLHLGGNVSLRRELSALGSRNLLIFRARHIRRTVLAKESLGAFRLATQLFSVDLVRGGAPENRTREGVLSPGLAKASRTLAVEDVTLEGVTIPSAKGLLRGQH